MPSTGIAGKAAVLAGAAVGLGDELGIVERHPSRGQIVRLTAAGVAWIVTAGRKHHVHWRERRGIVSGISRDGRQVYVKWAGRSSPDTVPSKFLEGAQ